MINVFITVGTTPFDELIRFCDENIDSNKFEVLAQVSNFSKYEVQNIKSIEFSANIKELYSEYDIIISHAGAGSVYNLLEMNKKCIFIGNFTMKDNHQDDICKFVQENNYAEVLDIRSYQNINKLIDKVINKNFTLYSSRKSGLVEEIYNLITIVR